MTSIHSILHDLSWADWQILDPGPSGVIHAGRTGIVDLVSAGAETRTLNNPLRAGIILGINGHNVGAGNVVVTTPTAFTQAGSVNASFGAHDFLLLISVKDSRSATGFGWHLIVTDNPTLS